MWPGISGHNCGDVRVNVSGELSGAVVRGQEDPALYHVVAGRQRLAVVPKTGPCGNVDDLVVWRGGPVDENRGQGVAKARSPDVVPRVVVGVEFVSFVGVSTAEVQCRSRDVDDEET